MQKYRCLHDECPVDEFEADLPVCPECKTDGRDPLFAAYIRPLVTIHFNPVAPHPGPRPIRAVRTNVRACDGKPIFATKHGMHFGTTAPSAVNCRACRESEAFKAEPQEEGDGRIPPEHDRPMQFKDGRIVPLEPPGEKEKAAALPPEVQAAAQAAEKAAQAAAVAQA